MDVSETVLLRVLHLFHIVYKKESVFRLQEIRTGSLYFVEALMLVDLSR
jgi:hypothetical protein